MEDYVKVDIYRKDIKDKELQLIDEKAYKPEEVNNIILDIVDYIDYEHIYKFIVVMTYYTYNNEYKIIDIKSFSCYSEYGCLRYSIETTLDEEAGYCFFDDYGFWFETFKKDKDDFQEEKVEEIYDNYDKEFEFVKESEEAIVYKEFAKLIER